MQPLCSKAFQCTGISSLGLAAFWRTDFGILFLEFLQRQAIAFWTGPEHHACDGVRQFSGDAPGRMY